MKLDMRCYYEHNRQKVKQWFIDRDLENGGRLGQVVTKT